MSESKKCLASVPKGSYTYAARNSYRRCENTAGENGYCHVHAGKAVTARGERGVRHAEGVDPRPRGRGVRMSDSPYPSDELFDEHFDKDRSQP